MKNTIHLKQIKEAQEFNAEKKESRSQNPIKRSIKPLLVVIILISVIVGLSITQVALTNRVSTAGIELEDMQSEIALLTKENILLEQRVLEYSALTNVSNEAKALGFVEAKSQIYLTNPLPLAYGSRQE